MMNLDAGAQSEQCGLGNDAPAVAFSGGAPVSTECSLEMRASQLLLSSHSLTPAL